MSKGIFKNPTERADKISQKLTGRSFSEEHKKHIKEARKRDGIRPPSQKGSKWSEETRKKMKARKPWKLSEATKRKISKTKIGKNNPNWKGGIAELVERIRRYFKYRQWRSDVFTRDNFTCQECSKRGGNLEAHHIEELSEIVKRNNIRTFEEAMNCEELWNINNGKTLCRECHNKTKKGNQRK